MFFTKNAYLQTSGTNPNLKSAVDQYQYLKILELGNVIFINEVLYKYRLHSGGILQQSKKQIAKDSFAFVIHDTMKRMFQMYIILLMKSIPFVITR